MDTKLNLGTRGIGRKMENCARYWLTYGMQQILMAMLLLGQLFLLPWLYLANWGLKMLYALGKFISIIFTFFITGIEGVRKRITRHYHANEIHYAVLKGNGQYLKLNGLSLEAVLVTQLYDYTIRKFMSLSQIQPDQRVAELQFSTTSGLQYLHQILGIKEVHGFSSKSKKIARLKELDTYSHINFHSTKYSDEEQPHAQPFDIFIFLNSGRESLSYDNCADHIRVLGWIRKNLNKNGYVIFGKYFDSDGQDKVFEELFSSFGLRIDLQEDITSNISHAEKMLKKIHKNRKIAWGFFKVKEMIVNFFERQNPISKMLKGLKMVIQKFAGRINHDPKYIVYILEKK